MRADAVVERNPSGGRQCASIIAAKYNGPLEAAHAHIDDDRFDVVECGTDE